MLTLALVSRVSGVRTWPGPGDGAHTPGPGHSVVCGHSERTDVTWRALDNGTHTAMVIAVITMRHVKRGKFCDDGTMLCSHGPELFLVTEP